MYENLEAMELLLKAKAKLEAPEKNGGELSLDFRSGGDGLRRGGQMTSEYVGRLCISKHSLDDCPVEDNEEQSD